jgi:RHS repeat-associated protein
MSSEPNTGKRDAPGWVSTPHGRFVSIIDGWQNEFHLRDHLGNTRVVVMEEDTGTLATLQQNHYYPFGMLNPSLSTSNTIGALKDNRYLYNGKEFNDDFDLDWYDYGARFYDAQIGRWNSVDPLAEKKPWLSPYHFCSNNPLNRLDPDGRDDFELNSKGQIVNRIENKKADNIYILNNDGKRIDGQTINFEYGTITAVRNPTVKVKGKDGNVSDKTLTLFEVKGNDNATKMFEFLANPSSTGVEWTHAKIGAEKSEQNVIGSSHDKSSTPVGHYLRATKYTLKEVTHNHPSGNYLPSDGDKSGAKLYKQQNSNTLLNIYTYPNRYSGYDEKGTLDFSDFENMPTIEVIGTKKN